MRKEPIIIKRDELYEKVWRKPMTTLAKEYGISDVGLGKICKKLNIPKPESGHWAKIATGKTVKPKELPLLQNGESDTYAFSPEDNSKIGLPDEISALIEKEKLPENKILVPEKYARYHKMISELPKEPVNKYDKENPRHAAARRKFDIRVTESNFARGLRIFDALIKALEQRGFSIIVKAVDRTSNVYVSINGIEQKITLSEKMKQIISPNYNPNNYLTNKYELIPSGIFKLEIDEVYYPYEIDTKAVRDTQTLKLEDRLNEFIIALLKGSVAKKKREEYFEEERIKREKHEQERQKLLSEIQMEKKKLDNLIENVKAYYQSYQMRLYIKAYEEDYVNKYGIIEKGSETDSWIKWAYDQADRIDPLKDSPSSVLDYVNKFRSWELEK